MSSPVSSSSSSNVTANFYLIGKYSVTVTAVNTYNQLSHTFTVAVLETVQNLLVLVNNIAVVGAPVRLTACCESGSNLTYVFDFRDHSAPVVEANSHQTTVSAVNVFTNPGLYNVSVSVFNAISTATKYIEIEVYSPDVLGVVCIENVTPQHVVGQISLFSAVTNGM